MENALVRSRAPGAGLVEGFRDRQERAVDPYPAAYRGRPRGCLGEGLGCRADRQQEYRATHAPRPAPLPEPVSESPVASRIAGLRSVFGTSPEPEGTGEKLDARIKALREASRAPADPESARDAGALLTRSRERESAPRHGAIRGIERHGVVRMDERPVRR